MSQDTVRPKLSEKGLLTPDNCVVAIIDLQPQMLFGVSNFDRQGIINNNVALAKAARVFGVPVVLSTVETKNFSGNMWPQIQAVFPDPRNLSSRLFTLDTLKAVEAQIVARCDALDGVKDGLIEDPRACKVDVGSLTGLTEAQRAALKTIYGETRNKDGVITPAQPVGGEGEAVNGWPQWIVGGAAPLPGQTAPSARFAFGTEMFKYFVFNDPAWDYSRYEFSNYKKDTALAATFLNATSPNLDAFKARGGKLILWHGWSDPALTALGSIKYYDQVQTRDPKAGEYFRMFLMPGVLHCAGGPGPDTADWTEAISDWVEHAKAPDRVVARKVAAGAVARTRPLCAYPQRAVYKGSGSIDEADSFVCR